MWLVRNIATNECLYLLNEKPKYALGRIGADLVLKDTSVSRTHAFLHVSSASDGAVAVELEDAGSKYGTYYNEGIDSKVRLQKGQRLSVHDGDRLRCGVLSSVFVVAHQPIASLATGLLPPEMEQFKQCVTSLGGRVVQQWASDCGATHLTISDQSRFSPTVKVLQALLNRIPLVTCAFWQDLLHAAKRGLASLPDPHNYKPQSLALMPEYKIDARFHEQRRRLFAGSTFVFINRKHYEMYAPIVAAAGGSCKQLNKGVPKALLASDGVVVIEYVPATQSQSSQTVNSISDYLELHSRRLIPEYEIGLAILTCSTSKYCNPEYKILVDLMPHPESQTEAASSSTPNTLFVPETEEEAAKKTNDLELVPSTIPESSTAAELVRADPIGKRKRKSVNIWDSDEDEETSEAAASKKPNLSSENDLTDSVMSTRSKRHPTAALSLVSDEEEDVVEVLQPAKEPHLKDVEPASKAGKRKAMFCSSSEGEESDGELFQIRKQPATRNGEKASKSKRGKVAAPSPPTRKSNSAKKATPKSSARPLPIVIVSGNGRKTLNTSSFLGKSQKSLDSSVRRERNDTEKETNSRTETEPAKRPRLRVLGEDDDSDDNDLFWFGSGRNERKDDSDEELFNFGGNSNAAATIDVEEDDVDDLQPTEKFIPKAQRRANAALQLPQPKVLPRTVNTACWLSCNKMKVEKCENDSSAAEHSSASAQPDWMETLKGGFEVLMRPLNVSTRARSATKVDEHPSTSTQARQLNNSGVNFKAFVKQGSFRPGERKVIKTISVPVGQFYM